VIVQNCAFPNLWENGKIKIRKTFKTTNLEHLQLVETPKQHILAYHRENGFPNPFRVSLSIEEKTGCYGKTM